MSHERSALGEERREEFHRLKVGGRCKAMSLFYRAAADAQVSAAVTLASVRKDSRTRKKLQGACARKSSRFGGFAQRECQLAGRPQRRPRPKALSAAAESSAQRGVRSVRGGLESRSVGRGVAENSGKSPKSRGGERG